MLIGSNVTSLSFTQVDIWVFLTGNSRRLNHIEDNDTGKWKKQTALGSRVNSFPTAISVFSEKQHDHTPLAKAKATHSGQDSQEVKSSTAEWGQAGVFPCELLPA